MEKRTVVGLPLSIFTDSVMGLSFVKLLTNQQLEVIKIPKHIDQFNQNYLLKSVHLIEVELVKTRKNWILKEIIFFETLFNLQKYEDFLKHKEIISILLAYIKEDQMVEILPFLVSSFMKKQVEKIDFAKFEQELLVKLGFAKENDTRTIFQIKDEGGIG